MVGVSDPRGSEPTPEFNDACLRLVARWEAGEIDPETAINHLAEMGERAAAEDRPVDQGRTEQIIAYIYHYRGNLDASIYHTERSRALYARAGNRRRVAIAEMNQGENYRYKGDFVRAVRLYQAAARTAEALNDQITQTLSVVNEGLALVALEQNSEARRALTLGHALAQRLDGDNVMLPRVLSEIHYGLAVLDLRAGDLDAAWNAAAKALDLTTSDGDPVMRGMAFRTLGEVVCALGHAPADGFSDDPDDYFRESLDAFQAINAEAEIARTMFSQALSLGRRGRRTMAARKLRHVMTLFSRLGMVHDAARAAEAQIQMT